MKNSVTFWRGIKFCFWRTVALFYSELRTSYLFHKKACLQSVRNSVGKCRRSMNFFERHYYQNITATFYPKLKATIMLFVDFKLYPRRWNSKASRVPLIVGYGKDWQYRKMYFFTCLANVWRSRVSCTTMKRWKQVSSRGKKVQTAQLYFGRQN